MEYTKFKINAIQKRVFENSLKNILTEQSISCNQYEFQYEADIVTVLIPKYCLNEMTKEQNESLSDFNI